MNLLVDLAKNWQTYPMILIYISHSVLGCESSEVLRSVRFLFRRLNSLAPASQTPSLSRFHLL
jgi:hypothetical protein